MEASSYHTPVLLEETLSLLLTAPDGTYVDCTLGGGGHAEAILQRIRGGKLIGFDRDAEAIKAVQRLHRSHGNTFTAVHASFAEFASHLERMSLSRVNGILMDLGVSSHHLDDAKRGFSFQKDGPLDMRMDTRAAVTAEDVVNTTGEKELADILLNFGEERRARQIARRIVRSRPINTTTTLRAVLADVVGERDLTKTLARVFQAIRIEVNKELDQLTTALSAAPSLLAPGGRVVVLSYHSLEDRIVKDFFRQHSASSEHGISKFLPSTPLTPDLRVLTKRPVLAGDSEVARNARARSAKLRAAERL